MKVISSRLIFGLPAGINSVIQDKIGECEILHPVKLMINQIQNLDAEKGLILSVNSKSFYLVLFENKTILSANSFKINQPNDIVYFLLSTLKQMQFDTKSIRLFLNETVDNGDEIVSLLKPYFNKVEYLPINNAPHISETIQPQTIYGNFLLSTF